MSDDHGAVVGGAPEGHRGDLAMSRHASAAPDATPTPKQRKKTTQKKTLTLDELETMASRLAGAEDVPLKPIDIIWQLIEIAKKYRNDAQKPQGDSGSEALFDAIKEIRSDIAELSKKQTIAAAQTTYATIAKAAAAVPTAERAARGPPENKFSMIVHPAVPTDANNFSSRTVSI